MSQEESILTERNTTIVKRPDYWLVAMLSLGIGFCVGVFSMTNVVFKFVQTTMVNCHRLP